MPYTMIYYSAKHWGKNYMAKNVGAKTQAKTQGGEFKQKHFTAL